MNRELQKLWDEVHDGRISEVPTFILEYIFYHGSNPTTDELVAVYFYRLETEDE